MRTLRPRGWFRLALAGAALCLVPLALSAQDGKPVEPAQKLEQVKTSFEERRNAIYKELRAAESDEDRAGLFEELKAIQKQAVLDMRALAEAAAGTEVAAEAWTFVLGNAPDIGNNELAGKAFDTLLSQHLTSPVWQGLSGMFAYVADGTLSAEKFEKGMTTLMEKSPQKGVQAGAMFALGKVWAERADLGKEAEGKALLKRVLKDYAGVKEAADSVAEAEGTLFALENLKVGMPCPDFEASDENGVKFKLSEYKGKVVLIDFWGFW